MNLARGLERRLENLVDGVSASVFRGHMHPVTMAARLVRQLDFLSEETPAGPQVPNDLTVVLHPADLDPDIDTAALQAELEAVARAAVDEEGWRIVGPLEVHVATSTEVPRGILQVAGSATRGRLEPWGQLISADGAAAVPLAMNRIVVGRALDCDVRFSNAEVSRHHALISRIRDDVRVADLGSSNGTRINGDRIAEPAALLPGTLVTFGNLHFTYRMVA
jgi:hypothetical protein